jgi:hypothetical protein
VIRAFWVLALLLSTAGAVLAYLSGQLVVALIAGLCAAWSALCAFAPGLYK